MSMFIPLHQNRHERYLHFKLKAAFRADTCLELPADGLQAFFHPGKADALHDLPGTDSVVLDRHVQEVPVITEIDADQTGVSVLDGVGQAFLHRAYEDFVYASSVVVLYVPPVQNDFHARDFLEYALYLIQAVEVCFHRILDVADGPERLPGFLQALAGKTADGFKDFRRPAPVHGRAALACLHEADDVHEHVAAAVVHVAGNPQAFFFRRFPALVLCVVLKFLIYQRHLHHRHAQMLPYRLAFLPLADDLPVHAEKGCRRKQVKECHAKFPPASVGRGKRSCSQKAERDGGHRVGRYGSHRAGRYGGLQPGRVHDPQRGRLKEQQHETGDAAAQDGKGIRKLQADADRYGPGEKHEYLDGKQFPYGVEGQVCRQDGHQYGQNDEPASAAPQQDKEEHRKQQEKDVEIGKEYVFAEKGQGNDPVPAAAQNVFRMEIDACHDQQHDVND